MINAMVSEAQNDRADSQDLSLRSTAFPPPSGGDRATIAHQASAAPHTNWWNHDSKNQIAFGRGDRGYVAINLEPNEMDEELQTGLEPGSYCDVLSGDLIGFYCKGKIIIVDDNGNARIRLDGKKAIAIHAWSLIRR